MSLSQHQLMQVCLAQYLQQPLQVLSHLTCHYLITMHPKIEQCLEQTLVHIDICLKLPDGNRICLRQILYGPVGQHLSNVTSFIIRNQQKAVECPLRQITLKTPSFWLKSQGRQPQVWHKLSFPKWPKGNVTCSKFSQASYLVNRIAFFAVA